MSMPVAILITVLVLIEAVCITIMLRRRSAKKAAVRLQHNILELLANGPFNLLTVTATLRGLGLGEETRRDVFNSLKKLKDEKMVGTNYHVELWDASDRSEWWITTTGQQHLQLLVAA